MNFRCNDIKHLVVKVNYLIDKENKIYRKSTGVILRPANETNYFFVLTTKHSFKEYNEESFEDVVVDQLYSDDITIIYSDDHTFQPLKIIDTTSDLVILVVESSFCIDNNIENIKILDGDYTYCGFIGYADVSKGRLKCFDKCTYSFDHNEMIFEIDSNTVLQSSNYDEILATRGLSGSGLFTKVNNNYMLTGLISRVITDNNSFDCIKVSKLLKDISLDEYGDIEIISLEATNVEPHNQLHQEINISTEEYKIIIQEQVTKEFKELKETYLNGSEKKIHIWIEEIKASLKWNILSNEQKAKILYEEAKLNIEANNLEKSEELIQEIQKLDKTLYINRLLSWIEIQKNNIDKALLLLDNNEIATLNQKIAIYLNIYDFTNARNIIDSIEVEKRDYETYRLKAIYELYTKNDNYSQALKDINKSLSLNENYFESKRVKAIILFYKSTLFNVVPDLIPPVVYNNMLKIDKESQDNIQNTYNLLKTSNEYADKVWIATIKWILNRDDAIKYIKELYQNEEYRYIAIQFIIVYNLDIDIHESIKKIESEENINELYKIDTLIRYYTRKENHEKIFEFLDKYKSLYVQNNKLDNWYEHYINALLIIESYEEVLKFIEENEIRDKDEIKAQIYKLLKDYTSAYKLYKELFDKTNNPRYQLFICQMKSEENDWEYITKYTDYLLEHFQTERVIELVVLGEVNSQHFDKAKKIIDEWLPYISNNVIKDSFLRIKAMCENMLGNPNEAIEIYEKNQLNNTQEDILNLSYLYKKTNSQDKLESMAIKAIKNKKLDNDSKIQIASITKNSSLLINEVINNGDVKKSEKELALALYNQGVMNDLVISNIPKLIEEKKIIGKIIKISDFPELMSKINEQKKFEYALYQKSDIPTHQLNSDFFNRYCFENQEALFIRSAKRFNCLDIEEYKNTPLYLDITSLLLLFNLGKLQLVIDHFNKVFLPSNIFFILDEIDTFKELKDLLKINFELGKLHYSPEIKSKNIEDLENTSNLMISIYTILELNKEDMLICVDDRYVNSFQQTKNNLTIISVNDILFTLYKHNILSNDNYYSTLLKMRKRKYLYMLITSEEIIYQLKKCKINNNQLNESEDLKALKESFYFMVNNYKNLKSIKEIDVKQDKYEEPFFVTMQVNEINGTIINLWNEEFEDEEDRYIYLDWVMHNMFSINMTSFIQNKLPHNNDITKIMATIEVASLFTQAITIISDKNQKLYFEWLYHNFLFSFFKANQEMFSEFIDRIVTMILDSFLKEDRDKNIDFITVKLINNFPRAIKNKLFKNKKLMNELPFEEKITIGNLSFDNIAFLDKIKKVVNGSKLEKVISNDKQAVILKPVILKHRKYIKIKTNHDESFIDDTFMILSTSKQKRKKVLEANPQWFNMSNEKKKEIIEEIINIKNHYERLERLYQVQKDSNFYNNIQNDLDNRKLDFDLLIPNNIEILLNHFRLDKNLSFKDAFNQSIKILLNEESILKTIDTIHHFPIFFPNSIIDILKEKPEEEQMSILRSFLKTANSPISHIQLLKVLISIQNEKYKKLILYLSKKIFSKEFKLELEAFFEVKNFIKQEFEIRFPSLKDDLKLALIWAHTNKLMKYFNLHMIDYNWLIKKFKSNTNIPTLEIFRPESPYNQDVLNKIFNHEEFILMSYIYLTDGKLDYFKDTIIEKKLKHILNLDDIYISLLPILPTNCNIANSFFKFDMELLSEWQNINESFENNILNEKFEHIIPFLHNKYGFAPLEEKLQRQLVKYIKDYQSKESTILTLFDLLFFTKQLKNINDKKIFKLVTGYIKNISSDIETQEEENVLFEILICLPISQTDDLKKRVKLVAKYIQLCKILDNNKIKLLVNKFIMELPLKYSKYFVPLKFKY